MGLAARALGAPGPEALTPSRLVSKGKRWREAGRCKGQNSETPSRRIGCATDTSHFWEAGSDAGRGHRL